jgi:SAM-dependent methyltransferase
VDTEYGTTADRFSYYLCADCECLSIHPLPADRLAEIYPPTYYSFASGSDAGGTGLAGRVKGWFDLRGYRRAVELLRTDRPAILDVGGGTGEISSAFVRRGGAARALVVDPDPASIEAARRRGLSGFAGTIEQFEADGRFDLVLMLNLIEHVADPEAVLAKASRLLAPGGLVWLQTPNFRALDGRLFRHRNWAGYHCPRHWALFSETGLRRLLTRAGLEPLRFERSQGGSFWAQSLLGLRRARLARRGDAPVVEWADGEARYPKPLVGYRAFGPLAALGAGFDVATRRLRQVSQLVVLARRSAS